MADQLSPLEQKLKNLEAHLENIQAGTVGSAPGDMFPDQGHKDSQIQRYELFIRQIKQAIPDTSKVA